MPLPTIADVARAAGVSKATVSRILNGDTTYIRAETRARVQQVIEQLAYRPSSVARSLTSRRTQTIAMLISDVANPFYADVIHGVEDVTLEKGYTTFLCNTNYDAQRGLALVRALIDRRVDGILLMSSLITSSWLDELVRHSVPTVIVDWQERAEALHAVRVAYDTGIQAAAEHLIALGHRRIAHISGPLQLHTARERRDAFLNALQALNFSAEDVLVIEGQFTLESGREAAAQILSQPADRRPTAIFAANDLMALGALSAARAANLPVPQALSVIGLDDIWLAAQAEPPLTTVALPRYQIGAQAAQTLLQVLSQPGLDTIITQVESALTVRQSTAPPPL